MISPSIYLTDDSPRARFSDPATSHYAADSNENRRLVMDSVLGLLLERPMSDEELEVAYFLRPGMPDAHGDSPRKRRSDLTKKGLVVATKLPAKSSTGRKVTVWAVAL
jgi:hypothetical protein